MFDWGIVVDGCLFLGEEGLGVEVVDVGGDEFLVV